MTPISICIISKNEEAVIGRCLESIQSHFADYPHEIILADTGSTDNTVAIAGKYTNKIYHFDWIDDFSAARNFAAEKAKNNWILVLDCDEYITEIDLKGLNEIIRTHSDFIGCLTNVSVHNETQTTLQITRLYNKSKHHYRNPVHEQIYPLAGKPNPDLWTPIPLTVTHTGYDLSPEHRKQKALRDIKLLEKMERDYPPSAYTYYQLGQCYDFMNEREQACSYYEKALEFDIDPKEDFAQRLIIGYGYDLLILNRAEDALFFQNIYDDFSYSADFVCLMGIIYRQNNMLIPAMTEFLKATTYEIASSLGCNSFIPYFNMGEINELLGDIETAKALYQKCGDYAPAQERLKSLLR